MSAFDRIYTGLKSVITMNERFDRVDAMLRGLGEDIGRLSASHAELAQRVARIEGMIEGAAMAARPRKPIKQIGKPKDQE